MATVHKLLHLLSPRERSQLAGVLLTVLVMGLLQLTGVSSILSLVSLLANPEVVHENPVLSWTFRTLSFNNAQTFLLFIGIFTIGVIVISNAFIALTIWLITHFAWANQHRLSVRLLASYLSRPYTTFLNQNSSDIGKNVLTEVQLLTNGVMLPLMRLIAFGTVAAFMVGFLVWFDPVLAGIAAAVVGGGYILVFFAVRHSLLRAGQRRMSANTVRFKAANEALGGIKEIKVLGRESEFTESFNGPAEQFARATAMQQILSQIPRYAIEALAFGSVLVVVLYLSGTSGDLLQVVPIISVYGFAGYRLIPAMQQVYHAWAQVRFNRVVVDTIYNDFSSYAGSTPPELRPSPERLPYQRSLELQDVTFTYADADKPAVKGVSFIIPKGSCVALVGKTGAGKTTLVDIILGLLRPQAGAVKVDDTVIDSSNLRAWQNNLGYVPQDIYLMDDTVAANIAFGVPSVQRDEGAIMRAARIADIHDFIVNELPLGYETFVGERGVRLSGGQRQRIGIARALYHDPEVLVLDEASGNLDQGTESTVHEAIQRAMATKTVIMIAHRLSTTRGCDTLYLMYSGSIVCCGTYDELIAYDGQLRAMTGVQ